MSSFSYQPPLREMRFVIEQVLQAPAAWAGWPDQQGLDAATAAEVLTQAGRFASEVLQPLNAPGDRQGCRLENGRVRTPDGFAAAWRRFVEGGWPALACDPAWGGQGLPHLLHAAVFEMLVSANHAWTMYPGLLHGAYETIKAHGSEALKTAYLPGLVSGQWLAAMALTEPQAGSDLGAVRALATPAGDGSLRVSGSKIFISGADQDLSEHTLHLVLCRLHDPSNPAPPGSKGLSLVLVPSVLPDGQRNAVVVDSLEHKMGLHGSATCALRYEGATGWLLGEAHRGLAAMFVMMNAARLHVALQGLGHLEMAIQNARRYAAQRLQFGRAVQDQPALRRRLLDGQAISEGLRVLMLRVAMDLDVAASHPDPVARAVAASRASLLTPVLKSFGTAQGFAGASEALQVWGGYGYVAEFGIEQTLRDARIAMIYEGTNEIQAIDLVSRKLLGREAAAFETLLDELAVDADAGGLLLAQLDQARQAVAGLRSLAQSDPEAPLRVADDLLAGLGHLLLAWAWCASLGAAQRCMDLGRAAELAPAVRAQVARHGLAWVLPQADVHWRRVRAAAPLAAVPA